MEKEIENILVPVDFNESSIKAARYAYQIAKKTHAKIILLNVIEITGILLDFFSSADQLVKITEKAKDNLHAIIQDLKEKDQLVEITSRVERGKPYQKILEVADKIEATLIIIGENHTGDQKTKDLGSTVYHVTLKSTAPVITYKGSHDEAIDRIVVPLDLTKQSKKQILSAIAYGQNYKSKIYLVSALIGGVKLKESRIYKKLKKAKRTLEKNNVDCEIQLFKRSDVAPYQRVLDFAHEINADMILVMTHQEGYTYDNYIGAFAHHIINESDVSVLSLTSCSIDSQTLLRTMVDPFAIFK
jgi:nucleotide-binding universal stress UspA family protein